VHFCLFSVTSRLMPFEVALGSQVVFKYSLSGCFCPENEIDHFQVLLHLLSGTLVSGAVLLVGSVLNSMSTIRERSISDRTLSRNTKPGHCRREDSVSDQEPLHTAWYDDWACQPQA
jgi:hypothetical protein